jgi:hypothetical protein
MESLIKEGAALKAQIGTMTTDLRAINEQIAANIEFNGKKSATLEAGGFKVSVTQRENIKWDRDRLDKFRAHVGDQDFFNMFKTEFKPIAKAINAYPGQKDIQYCRTVTPGAPSVTYKEVE